MNSEHPSLAVNETDREDLIAYLDGELAPEERVRIERRLAAEAPYRTLLKQLQQSWDMLDSLSRATATPGFTRTTLEMVAVSAESDVRRLEHQLVRRRRFHWLLGTAGVLGASAVGFVLVQWALPDPNAALVRDLPILQRLESYRHAESVDFLRQLQHEGLFAEEVADEG